MPVPDPDRQRTGYLALALGWVALGNAVTIVLLYTVAPLFGPLNDIGVAAAALLQGALAWRLRPAAGNASARMPLLAASLGAIVAAAGSGLVLSGLSGWFFAGLVTTLGYALLGVWLVAACTRAGTTATWPPRLAAFGRLIGGIMCLGFLAALALPGRPDDPSAAPWFLWIAYANGVGWFVLLPVWNVQLGRLLLAGGGRRGTHLWLPGHD